MVKNVFMCVECQKSYLEKEDAINCEKKHEDYREEQLRIHKENQKMVFSKSVKITKTAFDTHGGGVDLKIPKDCGMIILMGNKGGGRVPYRCSLPHQVYIKDLREAFEEHNFEVIEVLPVKSKDIFNVVYKDKYSFDRWSKDDVSCVEEEQ